MITCRIQYTLDPRKLAAFEDYAARWPPIIERCGRDLVGYYLPKEGANNFALALIDLPSLADYEVYRQRPADDADAKQNLPMVTPRAASSSRAARSCAEPETSRRVAASRAPVSCANIEADHCRGSPSRSHALYSKTPVSR
jgi:NIPSNAP